MMACIPPIWTPAHYHQPKWVPQGQSKNKAHHCSLFSTQSLVLSKVPTAEGLTVKGLCDRDETGIVFSSHANSVAFWSFQKTFFFKYQIWTENTILKINVLIWRSDCWNNVKYPISRKQVVYFCIGPESLQNLYRFIVSHDINSFLTERKCRFLSCLPDQTLFI